MCTACSKPPLWTVYQSGDQRQQQLTSNRARRRLGSLAHPGHSSRRDGPVDIYAGNLRSRDDTTLQGDTHTDSHSGLQTYQAHILQTEEEAV